MKRTEIVRKIEEIAIKKDEGNLISAIFRGNEQVYPQPQQSQDEQGV